MDYSGKIITKNAVTPTQTAASGVWTLDDALQAQKGNNWPIPGVPNPISKSLRFNSADSAYLNRTPAIAGNRKKWTWSSWVKRSGISAEVVLFRAADGISNFNFYFTASNTMVAEIGVTNLFTSTPVYRDVSAWYHIVLVFDSDNATADNRCILYVNGVSQAKASGSVSSGLQLPVNGPFIHYIGGSGSDRFINAYLTEINFVDGQALTPSDFGMTDTNTGVWIPKKYTGTYGTNGFYVNFKDATNTSTLGLDYSGNGNNWNANNFSVTAGAGNDSMTDVPTPWVGYSVNGDTGGVVRGNYCTWNPLAGTGSGVTGYGWTLANGNLDYTATNVGTYSNTMTSTFAVTSGKWYLEITIGSSPAGSHPIIGVIETEDISLATSTSNFQTATYISTVRVTDGQKSVFGSTSYASYGSSLAAGDILNIAIDGDNGKIWWGKNGTWFNSGVPASGTNAGDTFTPGQSLSVLCIAYNANGTHVLNAGQRPFAYTPPAGFLSLCTTNLPTPTIGATSSTRADDYFNAVLYTGNGGTQTVSGVGFQPDLTWIKDRSTANSNWLNDAVRGAGLSLSSNTTEEEKSYAAYFTAFNSDGFALAGGTGGFNANNDAYVSWNWKANGAGSSNTAGTITSTVSANTTAGFSIVTYTGNGSAGATVGHGLGVAPSMIVIKKRNNSDVDWVVYHSSLGNGNAISLNTTAASFSYTGWNSTTPGSSVFTLGSNNGVNNNTSTYVAYCFAPVAGYSAFGSYTGNGSADGPMVFTGFKPAYVMIKQSSASGEHWVLLDNKRNTENVVNKELYANLANAEGSNAGNATLDFLSNGFKIRTSNAGQNTNGATYIYAAFAESPFKYSLAR